MRFWMLLALLALPLLLCSCRTGLTVDGDPCYTLSEEEVEELVAIARISLKKPHRQLSRRDMHAIASTRPEITIHYNGDCSGEAKIRWQLPDKRASVLFQGLLNDPRERRTVFEIVPSSDRIIYKGVPGRRDTVQ